VCHCSSREDSTNARARFNVVFVYINEFIRSMLWSQVFFSIGEVFVALAILFYANVNQPTNVHLNNATIGSALFHAFQMLADEKFALVPRNLAFLIGDLSVVVYFSYMKNQTNTRKDWMIRSFYVAFGTLVFQLFLADTHSASIFRK
jgi:hypothetical protein